VKKVAVSEFLTLDGVIEDPGGGEQFDGGGWTGTFVLTYQPAGEK